MLLSLCRVVATLVRPLSALSDGAADLLTRLFGGEHPDTVPAGSEDELLIVTRDDGDDGVIEPEERKMIDNVLRLEETTARDIMVPRVDIVAVDEDASSQDIVDAITEKGHSRLPVYRESIDEIVGILYAKDLLPFVIGSTTDTAHQAAPSPSLRRSRVEAARRSPRRAASQSRPHRHRGR